MKCPENIVYLMHEYLDEDISLEDKNLLIDHVKSCEDCEAHFHELKKSIALVQSISHVEAPSNFTNNVMQSLPKEKRSAGARRWLRNHPFLTAASLFIVLMAGSIFSNWTEDDQFSVSKQPNLIIQNTTVTVPEGEIVEGPVIVKNGTLKIEGEINGDATVINGDQYLASAGNVTGEIKEINELFEWLWYHLKDIAKDTVNLFDQDQSK
ncbi:anti-sigma factor [Bacillus sp. SM2101]|uniref:anti-sigma factor family protein n=1 Tax=Bacillaceae TaxID=186817 RepID=UPI001BDDCB9D|nr:anti-sigma factor [Bacillus sp. SM2101]